MNDSGHGCSVFFDSFWYWLTWVVVEGEGLLESYGVVWLLASYACICPSDINIAICYVSLRAALGQKFIPILSCSHTNSHHRCYRWQSTFSEYLSLVTPEYQSWCIILHCHENWARNSCRQILFCHWRFNNSNITVKCVFISEFLWYSSGSPTESVSISSEFLWNLCGPCHSHSRVAVCNTSTFILYQCVDHL